MRKFINILIFILVLININYANWPLKRENTNGQLIDCGEITDVYGSKRIDNQNNVVLHLGVDCAVQNTNDVEVYPIASGKVALSDAHSVIILSDNGTYYQYSHINLYPRFQQNGTVVNVNTPIGTIFQGNFPVYHVDICIINQDQDKIQNPLAPQGILYDRDISDTPAVGVVIFREEDHANSFGLVQTQDNIKILCKILIFNVFINIFDIFQGRKEMLSCSIIAFTYLRHSFISCPDKYNIPVIL